MLFCKHFHFCRHTLATTTPKSKKLSLIPTLSCLRNVLKGQRSKSKENVVDMAKYNFQDILEPFAKVSEETAKSQYLSVSRYVAGQTTEFRKDSLKSYVGDDGKRDRDSGRYSKQSSGKSSFFFNRKLALTTRYAGCANSILKTC